MCEKKATLLSSEELPLRSRFSIYALVPVPLILWKIHAGVLGFETNRKRSCLLCSAEEIRQV